MELNAEQIIKALECCATEEPKCEECPYESECYNHIFGDVLAVVKQLTEENERLRAENDKQKLWENVLKAEAQEVPIKAERIRVADAITDEIYMRYRQGECFDKDEYRYSPFNCDKFKALIEDVRAKYIPEEKWEDRDC